MSTECPVCKLPIGPNDAACPHCGFKLLGSTQQFRPVTFPDEVIPQQSQPAHSATLSVVRGPQTGVTFQLGADQLVIGRSPQCDIFLNDMTVSRTHATLIPLNEGYSIRDEASFNGVWVNNDSVDECYLHSGDVIQIGVFLLLYQEG